MKAAIAYADLISLRGESGEFAEPMRDDREFLRHPNRVISQQRELSGRDRRDRADRKGDGLRR